MLIGGAALAAPAKTPPPQLLAITVDDLPAHGPLPPGVTRLEVANAMIAALKAAGAPATGFVNGSFGANDPDSPKVLAAWKAAGLPLGDHSFSHLNLNDVDAAAFVADIDRNKSFVAGQPKRFRYPFLSEGQDPARRDAVRAALAQRGYKIASVTLSFDDYAYNAPYVRCLAQRDGTALRSLDGRYLASARDDAARARLITRKTLGRDVPQVLLLHIGVYGAKMLPLLLAQYKAMGFRFATLDEVQKDAFYAAADPAKPGPSPTLEPLARSMTPPPPPKLPIPGDEVCPAPKAG